MPALQPPDTTITQTAQRLSRTNMNQVINSVNARRSNWNMAKDIELKEKGKLITAGVTRPPLLPADNVPSNDYETSYLLSEFERCVRSAQSEGASKENDRISHHIIERARL